jgi:poly-gamma-glutamate capsule biosynthesis protein CapA/YwtB (metallophosphatase superfamily)
MKIWEDFTMRRRIIAITFISLCLLWTGCTKGKPTLDVSLSNYPSSLSVEVSESIAAPEIIEESENIKAPKIVEVEEVKNITITSVGDIMMHEPQIKSGSLGNGNYDFSMMFKSIKPYIEKADFAIGNLETTLAGKEKKYTGYPMFNAPEILAKNIKEAGFDMVTTANNHSLDRKFYGVVKTIENLDNAGLLHIGTYKTKEDSEAIFVEDIKGIKVAFLVYTYGTNGLMVPEKFAVNLIDRSKIFEDIKKAKSLNVDMIITSMHFGNEYQTNQNKTQKDLVNFLFQNGVDVVLGSHPHVLQPVEMKKVKDVYGIEKERFVIYSQGNIVSNMSSRYKNSGVIINLNIIKDKNGTTIDKVEYIPTMVDLSYNTKAKKTTFEILPIFSESDYASHHKNTIIKQSFNDSIGILKYSNSKITLSDKEK